jgi:hypothetical protein
MNVSLRSKHQAPKREAFGCRDAPPRFIRGRRSRGLAPGWQTKGADIHYLEALDSAQFEERRRLPRGCFTLCRVPSPSLWGLVRRPCSWRLVLAEEAWRRRPRSVGASGRPLRDDSPLDPSSLSDLF